tara:strand:+ start:3472 stop:4188 length:717 start_codon:yes stop_codon:yes gene_type:complete
MRIILLSLFISAANLAYTQINISKLVNSQKNNLFSSNQLTEKEISDGLVEALIRGSKKSIASASKIGGFNMNSLIKIPFPNNAKKVKSSVIKIGFKKTVDQFEKELNYTAELAAKEALVVFVNAIKAMDIDDALSILQGENNAATIYLKNKTSKELHMRFMPIVKLSITKTEVSKYWDMLIIKYNTIPFVKPIDVDLEDYIITNTIKGLFVLIANEEALIRQNPQSTGSDLLMKVFGK